MIGMGIWEFLVLLVAALIAAVAPHLSFPTTGFWKASTLGKRLPERVG